MATPPHRLRSVPRLVVLSLLLVVSTIPSGSAPGPTPLAPSAPSADPFEGQSSPSLGPLALHTLPLVRPSGPVAYGVGGLDYDPVDHDLWIVGTGGYVEVFDWTNQTVVATIGVGTDPFGIAVDPVDNEVYVANSGSNNVSVISGATLAVVATVSVGTSPEGVAYDAADQRVFVTNTGSNNVSVLAPSTHSVVAWISVGVAPIGVAVDPSVRRVFVANHGSADLSVINASHPALIAAVPAGAGPFGVALDNRTGEMYVTNEASNNVTVVNATRLAVTTSIPVVAPQVDLQGIAYNPVDQRMWAGAGRFLIAAINTTLHVVDGYTGTDPSAVVYDPEAQGVCVTNTANVSWACIGRLPLYAINEMSFVATGVPGGAYWAVTVNSSQAGISATTQWWNGSVIGFVVPGFLWAVGTLDYTITPPAGYSASPAHGSVSAGGVVNVSVSPSAGVFGVTFLGFGLSPGDSWGVTLGTSTAYTSGTYLGFTVPNGTYGFLVAPPANRTASPANGTVVVNGENITVSISFLPATHYSVVFQESGLPSGTVWSVFLYSVGLYSSGRNITFGQVNGTYPFVIPRASSYVPTPGGGSVTVAGGPVFVPVTFAPSTAALWFNETGLASGATWGVTVVGTGAFSGSVTNTTSSATLRFEVPVGMTGNYSVLAPSGTTAVPPNGSLALPSTGAPITVAITFYGPSNSGPPPAIVAFVILPANVVEGDPFEMWLNVTGGTPPLTRSYAGLPFGCPSSNDSPVFCWPGSIGVFPITATVTDALGRSASASGEVSVVPRPVIPPAILNPWPGVFVASGVLLAVVLAIVLIVVLVERELRPRPPLPPYRL